MTPPTPETPSAHRGEPSSDELAAAQQVVDLFASEALLALDRFERSIPASATDRAHQVATRLANGWRKLELGDVRLDPRGSDAEQILGAAADLSLDPENKQGVSIEDASAYAANLAVMDNRAAPATTVADLRTRFDKAYGGKASEPERPADWLEQSLTRLARASVLRDVAAAGAKVTVSPALQQAADEMVRQGRQLMDGRQDLARKEDPPAGRPEAKAVARQAANFVGYVVYSVGVVAPIDLPLVTHLALHVPAFVLLVKESRDTWRVLQRDLATGLDPAQAQLRSVRRDLIGNLDASSPPTVRENAALRNAVNRRTGPDR